MKVSVSRTCVCKSNQRETLLVSTASHNRHIRDPPVGFSDAHQPWFHYTNLTRHTLHHPFSPRAYALRRLYRIEHLQAGLAAASGSAEHTGDNSLVHVLVTLALGVVKAVRPNPLLPC